MKMPFSSKAVGFVLILLGVNHISAQTTNAYDVASDSSYTGAGAPNGLFPGGQNGGYGFGTWAFTVGGTGGAFIQTYGPSGTSFDLWNMSGQESTIAVRTFASPLSPGQSFSVQLRLNGLNNSYSTNALVLQDSSGNTVFSYWHIGTEPNSANGSYSDANTANGVAVNFRYDFQQFDTFTFTLNSTTTYTFTDNTTGASFNGILSGAPINRVAFVRGDGQNPPNGEDFQFDVLQITSSDQVTPPSFNVITGSQTNIITSSPLLQYDVAYADDWSNIVQELFVISSPSGFPALGDRVCLKKTTEPDRYYMYTVDEARRQNLLAVRTATANRTQLSRSVVTQNGRFIEGDPHLFVDGDNIYMTGTCASDTNWQPVVDIYESPMYPTNGDFNFIYKATYDPSAIDPRYDYYSVSGQIACKEGTNYVLILTAVRVPKGQPATWEPPLSNTQQIQALYYALATQDNNGNFVWQGYPRMINAYEKNIIQGVTLGTYVQVQNGYPVTCNTWNAPSGGQINGMHLDGRIFEIDGQRWMDWVWFDSGNHIATRKIADSFSFADPSLTKRIWDTSVDVIQNANPVSGEQDINEGGTIFKCNGKYYFVFTHGDVVGNYGMSYVIGDSFQTVARGVGQEYKLFDTFPNLGDAPLHTPGLREIAGSGDVLTKADGSVFMFYGIGTFDHVGNYQGRLICYSKLEFYADGTIVPLKMRPSMSLDHYTVPANIQLSWTPLTNYDYHLNILANGEQIEFPHPTDPADYGSGYAQLNAGYLGNSTNWNLSQVEFVSTTYPGRNVMIPINSITNMDGFQLSYAYQGDWGSQKVISIGYNHRDNQYIPFDPDLSEYLHLSWSNLGNYEYHINVIQNNSEVVSIPGLGNGYLYLDAWDLGYSTYRDIAGFYFNPIGTSDQIWVSLSQVPSGYTYAIQVSYAYQGNWATGWLRSYERSLYNGTNNQFIGLDEVGNPPTPWEQADIGSPSIAGFSKYNNGTFQNYASGANNIWGAADQFRFIYQPCIGDVEIVARVSNVEAANYWAEAGIMIRETLGAGSKHVSVVCNGGNSAVQQIWRDSTDGQSGSVPNLGLNPGPYWVRITRSGNTITTYRSEYGTNCWIQIASVYVPMTPQVYVGLAISSGDASNIAKSEYDSVTVTGQPVPVPVIATIDNHTLIAGQNLALTNLILNPVTPPLTLTWDLLNAPTNMVLGSVNGILSWRPTIAQSLMVTNISLKVKNSVGQSATQSFTATVLLPATPSLGKTMTSTNGQFIFIVNGDTGPDYNIYASTDLVNWSLLQQFVSPTLPFTFSESNMANFNQRFYRIQLTP
jgi:hypothetical protein